MDYAWGGGEGGAEYRTVEEGGLGRCEEEEEGREVGMRPSWEHSGSSPQ